MKLADFRKLKLMMNMTISGSDQEKLTALAKVNEIIAKSNTTWDRILDRVIKVDVMVESVEDAMRDSNGNSMATADAARALFRKKIDDAFTTIEESDPTGTWADFVSELSAIWNRTGRLSPAQAEAILKGAKRVEERVR